VVMRAIAQRRCREPGRRVETDFRRGNAPGDAWANIDIPISIGTRQVCRRRGTRRRERRARLTMEVQIATLLQGSEPQLASRSDSGATSQTRSRAKVSRTCHTPRRRASKLGPRPRHRLDRSRPLLRVDLLRDSSCRSAAVPIIR
jgi:hypothetical protein